MRFLLLSSAFAIGVANELQAQEGTSPSSCGLDLKRCAVLFEAPDGHPFPGTLCPIPDALLERTECVFAAFLDERARRGPAFRDSVARASYGAIRPREFSRDRRQYYRQYGAFCRTPRDTLVYLNALYSLTTDMDRAVHALLAQTYEETHPMYDAHGDTLVEYRTFLASLDGLRPDGWRRHWIQVNDGGDAYFQVLFDLTTNRVIEFSVNGPYLVQEK